MLPRRPSRAFLKRDTQRFFLILHISLATCFFGVVLLLNRFLSPEQWWAHWIVFAWLPLLFIHAGIFIKKTLSTMGK